MPTVPNIDPSTLEAMTGGQVQPEPAHMMMAMADMHDRGRLIEPSQQSSTRTGKNMQILNFKPRRGRKVG